MRVAIATLSTGLSARASRLTVSSSIAYAKVNQSPRRSFLPSLAPTSLIEEPVFPNFRQLNCIYRTMATATLSEANLTDLSSTKTFNSIIPIKSETDTDRSYRVVCLPNALVVLLVSEPGADKAAAALDVHSGAFDDPNEFHGLAHFCEHMLFLGTEKYPVENSYAAYLAKHGGSSNASTSSENTTYYFDVHKEYLRGALDIFAQFFLCPLFTESCTDREMNAVNSEHSKNLQEDSRRIRQILRSLAHPDSDWSKFSTGSLETLNKPGVREKLLEFHRSHYSANRMKLCVLGKESLDELEAMVRELFSGVKNLDLPPRQPSYVPPYPKEVVSSRVLIVPVKDFRQLRIHFPMPSSFGESLVKPSRYFSHLLGHEGEGSAFALLKAKGWASALSAGTYTRTFQFEIFEVKVDLTEEGFGKRDEVLDIFMGHLKLITSTPPQAWIYEEMKKIEEIKFRFISKKSPQNFVVDHVDNLLLYPPELALKGPYYYGEFNAELIQKYGSYLRPDNMMVIEIAKALAQRCALTEKIYCGQFFVEPLQQSEIERWISIPVPPELTLPVPNEFIPDDLNLKPGYELLPGETHDSTYDDLPKLIKSTPFTKLWFLRDRTFLKPKAIAAFRLENSTVYSTPTNMTKMQLIERILHDSLNEYAYYSALAGLHYSVSSGASGIEISVDGYNDKLGILLKKVVERLKHLEIKPDRVEIHRNLLREALLNFYKDQPYSHASNSMNEMTILPLWTVEERLASLNTITIFDLQQFLREALAQVTITAFVHGNVLQDEAESLLDVVEKALEASPSLVPLVKKRVVQLKKGPQLALV